MILGATSQAHGSCDSILYKVNVGTICSIDLVGNIVFLVVVADTVILVDYTVDNI